MRFFFQQFSTETIHKAACSLCYYRKINGQNSGIARRSFGILTEARRIESMDEHDKMQNEHETRLKVFDDE